MTREASPLRDRLIFIVGARRSGTNWLQRMVCAHPATVGIPSETYLFSEGIKPLAERFQHGAAGSAATGYAWMERNAMLDGLREFCDSVFVGLRDALNPGAERVVERTPDHARCLDLIGAIYPDARVVHIVRDGRDVARSLLSQEWGPNEVAAAAEEWRSAIEAARTAGRSLAHYREVRYEDLLSDPRRELAGLWEWLGLPVTDEAVSSGLTEARVRYNVDPSAPRTGSGKWRAAFTQGQLDVIMAVAGTTLSELGYETDGAEALTAPAGAAPSPGERPNGFARLRRKIRAVIRRRRRAKRRTLTGVQDAQAIVDQFLHALAEGRFTDAAEMVRERGSVRIVGPDGDWKGRGTEARLRLARALADDPALKGRQVRADLHPSIPTFTIIASYEIAPGVTEDRMLLLTVHRGGLSSAIYYHAALGARRQNEGSSGISRSSP